MQKSISLISFYLNLYRVKFESFCIEMLASSYHAMVASKQTAKSPPQQLFFHSPDQPPGCPLHLAEQAAKRVVGISPIPSEQPSLCHYQFFPSPNKTVNQNSMMKLCMSDKNIKNSILKAFKQNPVPFDQGKLQEVPKRSNQYQFKLLENNIIYI